MRRLALLAAVAGCSGDFGVSRRAIVNGSLDSGDPAVVALVTRRTRCGELPHAVCTGTLIADRAVLTAAHCLSRQGRGFLEVFAGGHVGAGSYLPIAADVIHPSFRRGESDFDLAILWLSQPLAAAPLQVASAAPQVGQAARVVGFGDTHDGGTAEGDKLEGQVQLQAVDPGSLTYGPGPSMTCQGDSGGPVLVGSGGVEQLAGVTSEGDLGCVSFGTAARADVRFDDFIAPALAAGAPSATIAFDAICRAPCASSADCPADLRCEGSQCLVPPLAAGSLGTHCQNDGECGGDSCVPVGDSCLCSTPCTPAASGGCDLGGGGGGGLLLLLLLLLRRRQAARGITAPIK